MSFFLTASILQQHFHWPGACERSHHRRRSCAIRFAIRADERDAELIVVGAHADVASHPQPQAARDRKFGRIPR